MPRTQRLIFVLRNKDEPQAGVEHYIREPLELPSLASERECDLVITNATKKYRLRTIKLTADAGFVEFQAVNILY